MVDITDIVYLETEQDVTDSTQDAAVSNVDNTSDADKPVSTAQQAALDGKAHVLMNMRGYFDVATQTLYTTTDGTDPQP